MVKIIFFQWIHDRVPQNISKSFLSPHHPTEPIKMYQNNQSDSTSFQHSSHQNPAPLSEQESDVYSIFITAPKTMATGRPFWDLKFLNKFVKSQHFIMKIMRSVTEFFQPQEYLLTICFTGTYLHISVFFRLRFLFFCVCWRQTLLIQDSFVGSLNSSKCILSDLHQPCHALICTTCSSDPVPEPSQ